MRRRGNEGVGPTETPARGRSTPCVVNPLCLPRQSLLDIRITGLEGVLISGSTATVERGPRRYLPKDVPGTRQ